MFCYSFVLQHPKNRIVVPFETPSLYLVAIYQIYNNVDGNTRIVSINMEEIREKCEWVLKGIKFPKIYKWNNYNDLINKYKLNTSYKEMGLVIHNLLNDFNNIFRKVKDAASNDGSRRCIVAASEPSECARWEPTKLQLHLVPSAVKHE